MLDQDNPRRIQDLYGILMLMQWTIKIMTQSGRFFIICCGVLIQTVQGSEHL